MKESIEIFDLVAQAVVEAELAADSPRIVEDRRRYDPRKHQPFVEVVSC